jgi:hypothetical protein
VLHQKLSDGAARFVAWRAADTVYGDDSDASTHSALREGEMRLPYNNSGRLARAKNYEKILIQRVNAE